MALKLTYITEFAWLLTVLPCLRTFRRESGRVKVTFYDEKDKSETTVRVPLGENLLEAAHSNNVDLEGGKRHHFMTCGIFKWQPHEDIARQVRVRMHIELHAYMAAHVAIIVPLSCL